MSQASGVGPPRLRGATPGASSGAPAPFARRGPPARTTAIPPPRRSAAATQREEEEKEAQDAAVAMNQGGGGGWQGGPLKPSAASDLATHRRGASSVLGPLQSAQATGFEINHEIDSMRMELQEIRMSNAALQQTNQELHEALAQVTERSKMLSTEHARFLDEFREKSQRSKQQLVNERANLKTTLAETNQRLEDLEKLNNTIEGERTKLSDRLEELTSDHELLSQNYATLQKEQQIWQQKEKEYLEIQSIQTRNLDELNQTVLQIQDEREGWHQKFEESQGQLLGLQQHSTALEQTVQAQDQSIQQLNMSLLTSQEEIMNLTQTLATHLEQIANISKQNKELHATLVNFTKTSDKDFVSEYLANTVNGLNAEDVLNTTNSAGRIEVLDPLSLGIEKDPTLNPSFNGPIPDVVHSAAFLKGKSQSNDPAANFLHTTSGLSTLHLPASYLMTKLNSYILWILEHKQILENMMQRKEKLRKELEEQIVVANVEARIGGGDVDGSTNLTSPIKLVSPLSPAGSPTTSASIHQFSPTRAMTSSPLQAIIQQQQQQQATSSPASSALLLPSLLQHTLHDLHELTHLTQHDALQFENFEKEKIAILTQCSSHGFNKYNTKRVKQSFTLWLHSYQQRKYRRDLLCRVLTKGYFKQIARGFAQFRLAALVQQGRSTLMNKNNVMKAKILGALLQKTELAKEYLQQMSFLQWRQTAKRRKKLRQRLLQVVIEVSDNKILKLWNVWKENTLKLRHLASVAEAHAATEALQEKIRSGQLDKMKKMLARQLQLSGAQSQRTCFVSWRGWSQARRKRKHAAMRRLIYICCGQGTLIKAWAAWKEFRRTSELKQGEKTLVQTKQSLEEKLMKQQEAFLIGYEKLKHRFKSFKIYHWWRLAFVDTQWLKREDQWRGALMTQKQIQIRTLIKLHHKEVFLPIIQAWRRQTRESKRGKSKSVDKIVRRLANLQIHAAFRQWVQFTEQERVNELKSKLEGSKQELLASKQKFILSLVQKWRRHHLASAFQQFHSQVQAKKQRKREILDRTLKRLHQTQVWSAFRTWRSWIEKQDIERLQEKLKDQKSKFSSALVQRWRLGCMVPAFHSWRQAAREKKAYRREILDRTFKKMLNSSLWRAMRLWKRFTEQSSVGELKSQLSKQLDEQKKWRVQELIKKWRHHSIVPCWQQWQNFVAVRKQRKKDLLNRTCKRLEHSTIWKAFRTWMSFTDQTKLAAMKAQMGLTEAHAIEQRKKMAEHMLQKWRMSREKQRFLHWRSYAQQSRAHKKSILDRTLKHLSSGYLGRAFITWKKFIESSRLAEMHARLNENKAKTVQQVLAKWRHRILTTPFLNWRNHARKSKAHKREVIERMGKRLINSTLYRAWRTWAQFIEQTNIAAMKNKFQSQTNAFHTQLTEQKQKRIAALIQRWRGASLTTRFQQWRMFARSNRQHKKVRFDQVFRRLVSSTIWKAWRQWKMYVEKHHAHEQAQKQANEFGLLKQSSHLQSQQARQKHILTKTFSRMVNLLLFSGWRTWSIYVQRSRAFDITKQKRELELQTAQLREQQSQLVRSHTQQNLLRQQQLVDKTLRRIANANLYRALKVWKKNSEDAAVHDMRTQLKLKENNLKLKLLADRIQRHRHLALQPCMQRWRKYAKETRARKKELLGKMIQRWMNLSVWQSLRHWKEVTQQMAIQLMRTELESKVAYQKKQRLEHLIRTWRHRSLAPSFIGWKLYVAESHKRKRLIKKIFARIEQLHVYQAMRQWKLFTTQAQKHEAHLQRRRVIIDRTFKRMCSSMLYRALRTWKSFVDQTRQSHVNESLLALRSKAVLAKLNWLNRSNIKANFLEWRRYIKSAKRERTIMKDMLTVRKNEILDRTYRRLTAASLLKTFQHWRTYILRARLIVNDKLGEYSEMILTLRKQSEVDSLKLHEFITENQKLKSNILSIKHKQHTLLLMQDKQKENRAILFAYNTILAKTFRNFYQRVHALKRRKALLNKTFKHHKETALLRAFQIWKKQIVVERSAMMKAALDSAKKQLDQCLAKVWTLEAQLAERTTEAANIATESQQILLNAQAQEMNHELEKQMPNEREIALAQEVDTLAAKLELLLKEVKERGNHIQFLSAENQRLSTLVKTAAVQHNISNLNTSTGPISVGFPSPTTSSNNTLNLSTSFGRSRTGSTLDTQTPLPPNGPIRSGLNRYLPTTTPAQQPTASFLPATNSTNPISSPAPTSTSAFPATQLRPPSSSLPPSSPMSFFPQSNISFQ